MQETWVPSLGGEGPTPVFLPGELLWREEPGGQSMGSQRVSLEVATKQGTLD